MSVIVRWADGGRVQETRQYQLRPTASIDGTQPRVLQTLGAVPLFNLTSLERRQSVAVGNFTMFAPTTPGRYALTARLVTPDQEQSVFASDGQTLRVYSRNELTDRRTKRRLIGFEVLGVVFLCTAFAQLFLEIADRIGG